MGEKTRKFRDAPGALGQKDRFRTLKILAVLLFALILVVMLSGCAPLKLLPYSAPYPEYVLAEADPWIKSVTYLSDFQLQEACYGPERVMGCYNVVSGAMFVISDPALSECVLRHEQSHVYEMFAKGVPYAESKEHKGWHQPYCYKPSGFRPQSVGVMATLP